jgi:hypothetical protein
MLFGFTGFDSDSKGGKGSEEPARVRVEFKVADILEGVSKELDDSDPLHLYSVLGPWALLTLPWILR